jgi:hypothetical protein
MDIRLDYIYNFKDGAKEKMTEIREKYMDIDKMLYGLFIDEENPALKRTFAIARTNLEISLMYAIKTCCLKYEDEGAHTTRE